MKKSLFKNLISFILICVFISSLSVALFAASAGYNDGILGATLYADKHIFGDTVEGITSDMIDTHECFADGELPDMEITSYLYVEVTAYVDYAAFGGNYEEDINLATLSCQYGPGFGKNMTSARSTHRINLYCEGESSSTSLSAQAD